VVGYCGRVVVAGVMVVCKLRYVCERVYLMAAAIHCLYPFYWLETFVYGFDA